MTMIEVQESTQDTDQHSGPWAVNISPGISIDSLTPHSSQVDAVTRLLDSHKELTSQERDAILFTSIGMATNHGETVQKFNSALNSFQASQNAFDAKLTKNEVRDAAKPYVEVVRAYEDNPQIREQADVLAKIWTNLYSEPITGREVLGGLYIGGSVIDGWRKMSPKKKLLIVGLLLAGGITACAGSQETAPNSTIEITFNVNISVNSEVVPITEPMHGLLSDSEGRLIDPAGNVIAPVPQGDKFLYTGVSATENEFQFATIDVGEGRVTVFQQVENGNPSVMMFVSEPDEHGAYTLIDENNVKSDYTISLFGNKIVLNDNSTGLHYLITAATFLDGLATPAVIDSPTPAIDQLQNSYPVYNVSFNNSETVQPQTYEVHTQTAVPSPTAAPTETPNPLVNAPPGTTRAENGKYYMDKVIEGNEVVVFEYTKILGQSGETLYEGWTMQKTVGEGIPLIDWTNTLEGYERDIGFVNLFVSPEAMGSFDVPSFSHTNKTVANANDSDLTSRVIVSIFNRTNAGRNPNNSESWQQDLKLQKGEVPISFTTTDTAIAETWNISPDNGASVFLVSWDSLEGSEEFFLHGVSCRSKVLGVDKDGNLVGVIAVNAELNTLTEDQWWRVILFHAASVIDHADQSQQGGNETLESWIAFADNKFPNTWIVQTSE